MTTEEMNRPFEIGDRIFECQDLTYYYDVIIHDEVSLLASQWVKPSCTQRIAAAQFAIGARSDDLSVPRAEEMAVSWCIQHRVANRIPHLEAQVREKKRNEG